MKDEDKAPKPPFPKPVKLGRRVAWRADDIEAYIKKATRQRDD